MFSDEFTIAWPFFFASVIALGLAISALKRKRSAASFYFTLCMVAAGIWSMSSGLHLMVEGFGAKLFWADSKFLFVASLPVFWLLLALSFSKNREPIKPKTIALLLVFPVLTVLMVATNSWHHLVFKAVTPLVTDRFVSISRDYGPWFWMHTAYSYALIVTGVGIFIRCFVQSKGHLRSQAIVMAGGSLIPFVFNAVYLSNQAAFYYLDFTPVAFAATGVFYFYGLFKFRMLDLMPIAMAEIVRSMEDAVVVTDTKGFIVDTNDAASNLKLSTDASEIGQLVSSVYPFLTEFCNTVASEDRLSKEIFVELDNIQAWFKVDSKVILDKRKVPEGRLIVLRDITESKTAQIQLEDAKKKAEELSTLKSAFLSNMSHDVRTPLAGIIGLADLLADECTGDQQQFAAMIKESGDRLLKLINSLLSVSHLSSGTLDQNTELLNLVDLSRRVMAPVEKDLISHDIELNVSFPDEVIEAELDPNHLAHALTHILDHAVKFTEKGSIHFTLLRDGNNVLLPLEIQEEDLNRPL